MMTIPPPLKPGGTVFLTAPSSPLSDSQPAADAAAVAGEPRNISTLDVPMRPRKFLLFVASTLSPSVRMPHALPQHSPHPG